MLGWKHYGSTNEVHKIAYEKQALAPRNCRHQFFQVRELQGAETTPHSLHFLRFLPGQKSFGPYKKDGKEAKENESEESGGK